MAKEEVSGSGERPVYKSAPAISSMFRKTSWPKIYRKKEREARREQDDFDSTAWIVAIVGLLGILICLFIIFK